MSVDVKKRWAGESVERRAPVAAFVDALSELMEGDDRVVTLIGDQSARVGLGELGEQYSDRFFHGGSAQQNLIGMAAGLASMGKVAVVVTAASSIAGAAPLLNIVVAQTGLHVVLAALPSGLAGCEGDAGHTLIDLGVLGAVPGLRVLAPTDAEETAKALITLVDEPGPGYLRLSSEPLPQITGPDTPFDLGHPLELREGGALTLCASGPLVYEALVAADLLEDQGIEVRVLAVHSFNPFEPAAYVKAAEETGALLVVEEHAAHGGIGAAVARVTSSNHPVAIGHLHTGHAFCGAATAQTLRKSLGLDAESIASAAQNLLARKG